jgi:hypothetical protein
MAAAATTLASAANLTVGPDVWRVPLGGGPLPPLAASVGDAITFSWAGTHSVFVHPSGNCSTTGAVLVGTSPPASYTFRAEDVGPVVFACHVINHCSVFGMIMTVNVSASGGGGTPAPAGPAPTNAPTVAPAKAPTKVPTKAPTKAPVPATCSSVTYKAWTKAPGGGRRQAVIRNGSTFCLKHPYNIQLVCSTGASPPSLPVTIRLLNGKRRVVRRQVDPAAPFALWGPPRASGAVSLSSPGRLPNGPYFLQSSAGAGETKFTQRC